MKSVGYIGLGIMGRPMALNLIKAGYDLYVWNRTASKTRPLVEAGATVCKSMAEVAEHSEVVCINVTDTADVEQVIFGEGGILDGNPGNTADFTIIDHSTIDPGRTREFAAKLAGDEVDLLDAPVSGGDSGAIAGTLSVMVGGDREAFDRCRPIFDVVGKTVTYCGPAGSGQATKACNQVLCALNLLATCEALALARREGLDLRTTIDVTRAGAGGSWQLENLGPKLAEADYAPGFMIDLLNKDLNIVSESARRHLLSLPGMELAASLFRSAAANGHGADGTQALASVIEQLGHFTYHA